MRIQHLSACATPVSIVAPPRLCGRKAVPKWIAHGLAAGALCLATQPALAITVYDITLVGLYDAGHTRSDGLQHNDAHLLNESGQVTGFANRYNGSAYMGTSAWLYNGSTTQQIGLTGTGHTRSDGYQSNEAKSLNDAGQVAGSAFRYKGSINIGASAWLYNGGTTQEIGLTGVGHTRSDGYQRNNAWVLNTAGQVSGYAERFSGRADMGRSAWFYNGNTTQEIGLTGVGHTRSDGYQYNDARLLSASGQVAGFANRYNGSTYMGTSAWLYNSSTTQQIGLTGAGHSRSDGFQYNLARSLNASGQVAGVANRYSGSTYIGTSAWLYTGGSTQQIGLTGAGYTRSSDGYQANAVLLLNEAGQVAGRAERYNDSTHMGTSTWLYSGNSTQVIGLTDAGHIRSDGYQYNQAEFLNAAGEVVGRAKRYIDSTDMGQSAWFYDGSNSQEIGLTDAGHIRSDGYQYNQAEFLNAAGNVAGWAARYDGLTPTGSTAWFYDPLSDQVYSMETSVSALTGDAYSSIAYLGDDGLALGTYSLFDVNGVKLGNRAFSFTVADGWNDLGSLVDGELSVAGWDYLASTYRANGAGQILGRGVLAGTSGQAAYLLTPVPEPETWAMLLAGLGLVGWVAKRRKASTAA